ncbi:MAG: hypothetical protein WCI74_18900 [Actinomycetes bacterium]
MNVGHGAPDPEGKVPEDAPDPDVEEVDVLLEQPTKAVEASASVQMATALWRRMCM